MRALLAVLALLALLTSAMPAAADWDPEDPSKWVQLPDFLTTGIDVNATYPSILADDFLCTEEGFINDIHIWGSWYHDEYPVGDPGSVLFVLSIHEDIPATVNPDGYSIPGDVLWMRVFEPDKFTVRQWAGMIMEGWVDPPDSLSYEFPADSTCWQYNFDIPDTAAFFQHGTTDSPRVYWLDVQAHPEADTVRFGWKTSLDHWNDDAVWGEGLPMYIGPWDELRYPPGHQMHPQSIDLAFAITTKQPEESDWGDAPNSTMGFNYPTVMAENGANHASSQLYMGPSIDYEPNGIPHPNGLGDDNNNLADEDGVIFTSPLLPGLSTTVDVIVNGAPEGAYIDAWVDFGADGSWAEATDQIFNMQFVSNGTNSLDFTVPTSAAGGSMTFARFRLSTVVALPYTGPAPDGEVEDCEVYIQQPFDQPAKWIQYPDLGQTGIDVNATYPYVLADDFLCEEEGFINDIHIWGSWYHDEYPWGGDPGKVMFVLSIHEDIPESLSATGYSMPGEVLWHCMFYPGEFTVELWADQIREGWLDPSDTLSYEFPADSTCWQYNFDIPDSAAFLQQGTPDFPKVYWLDVQAEPFDPAAPRFGWKTSLDHWNDDAVWGSGNEPYDGPWDELIYPLGHEMQGQSIDLAFAITTKQEADWGDAPDSTMGYFYPTVAADNGANHALSDLYMGTSIDAEPDGLPGLNALGDDDGGTDDEDGVVFTTQLLMYHGATVDVIVNGAPAGAYVDAWVDFGANGSWANPTDQIFSTQPVFNGKNSLGFNVPPTAVPGKTFARFRISGQGNLSYTGSAPNGEVEDYVVYIQRPDTMAKWIQYPNFNPTDNVGIDVNATEPFILADDFRCVETGRIHKICAWGSWDGDVLPYVDDPTAVRFILSLHEDIPDSLSPTGFSMPGDPLWWKAFDYPEFQVALYQENLREGWMDPPDAYIFPADSTCWLYTFPILPEDHLYQVGTPLKPKVYWLDVQARPLDPAARFGWKTSLDHWNAAAVWAQEVEPYPGPWDELIYPAPHPYEGQSIDLAFGIFSSPTSDVPDGEIPREFGLKQNAPNPFNPATTIVYEVPEGGAEARVEIFDVAGRHVATLVDGFEPEGTRRVTWNGLDDAGRHLPSGVYFYRLVGNEFQAVKKMLLLK